MTDEEETPTEPDLGDLPTPEEAVIVVHDAGWNVFETRNVNAPEIKAFVDQLVDDQRPESARFNADAHPDHSSVKQLDASYETLDVRGALREYREAIGDV